LKLSREVKTGILAIGAILLFIFGYSFLKGTNLLENHRTFYVKYQNVEGLAKSAPVTINGLKVGKVTNIGFANKTGGLVVEFTVEQDFDFSRNSLARIYSSGLIGGKSLGIFPEYDQANIAKSGDTLKGEIEKGMLDAMTERLGPLEAKVQSTLGLVDTLLINMADVIDEDTRINLKKTIASLTETSEQFKGISKNMNSLLSDNKGKLDRTFANFDITTQNFAKLSDSLAQIETGKMVADIESVTSQLNELVSKINSNEGSVGKLLKDEELYDNLTGASKQLEQLLEDMKLNPKRYVHFSLFGKRPKEYNPPEDPNQ
jgi:phospholipid/cholesterol/gamma-HCH transport system substrate-binding protein